MMRPRLKAIVLTLVVGGVLLGVASTAGGASTKTVSGCQEINQSGTYVLNSSITNATADPCIHINASNVHFDGNGHVIDGQNAVNSVGVQVGTDTLFENVTVSNVSATQWGTAIFVTQTNGTTVRNASVNDSDFGVYVSSALNATVSETTVTNTSSVGIGLDGSEDSRIQDSTITNSTDDGILSTSSPDNIIEGVTVRNSTGDGIFVLSSPRNEIHAASVTNGSGAGVHLQNSDDVLLRDVSAHNLDEGINITTSADARLVDTVSANHSAWAIQMVGESARNITGVNVDIGTASMNFTARAVAVTGVDSPPDDPRGRTNIGQHLNVTNTDEDEDGDLLTDTMVSFFDVNVTYVEADLPPGVNESDLDLFNHTSANDWQRVEGSTVHPEAHVVGANLSTTAALSPPVVAPLGELSGPKIGQCRNVSSAGTYRIVQNITNASDTPCLWITASDVILNGQGFTVDGTGSGTGIQIFDSSTTLTNVTVRNLTVSEWEQGIWYADTMDTTTVDVHSENTTTGVLVEGGNTASIQDVTVNDSSADGIRVSGSDNATLTNVTVTNVTGATTSGGVEFVGAADGRIEGATIRSTSLGVRITDGDTLRLSNLAITGTDIGVNVSATDNVSIRHSVVADNAVWDVQTGDTANNTTATNLTLTNATVDFTAQDVAVGGIDSVPADPVGKTNVGAYFNATNTDPPETGIGGIITSPSRSFLNISVFYNESDIPPGASEDSLNLYGHNGTAWALLPNQTGVNTTANTVSGNISNVDIFADDAFAPLANFTSTDISTCRGISSEGTYTLTRNLTNVTDTPCIQIGASNVTLDGQGFIVDGTGAAGSVGILAADSTTLENVTVRNLTVQQFGEGIRYDDVTASALTELQVHNNTQGVNLTASDTLTLSKTTFRQSSVGIRASGTINLSLMDLSVRNNTNWDILTSDGAANTTATNLTLPSTTLAFTARDVALVESDTRPAPPRNHDDVGVFLNATNTSTNSFLNASLTYQEANVGNFDESTIRLWQRDNVTGNWSMIAGSSVNVSANRVRGNVTTFSTLAPLGNLTRHTITQCRDITDEGEFQLTTNLTNVSDSPCLHITANNVSLVGQGFVVDGTQDTSTVGILAQSDGTELENVTVSDLTVRQFASGVVYRNVSGGHLAGTTLRENALGINITESRNVTIASATLRDGATGVVLDRGRNNTVSTSSLRDSGTSVHVLNSSAAHVRNSTIRNSTIGVLITAADNVSVTHVTVSNSSNWDIRTFQNATNTSATNVTFDTARAHFTARDVALVAAENPPSAPDGKADIEQFLNASQTDPVIGTSRSVLDVNITYTDGDVGSLNESSLRMHRHNETAWVRIPGSTVDENRNIVTANVTNENISLIAPLANISANEITECTTIDSAGDFRLATDVTADTSPCIKINASDVSLDGQGFNVTGTADTGIGVAVAGPVTNVTIRNLSAVDFERGLNLTDLAGGTVENVTVASNRDGIVLTNTTDTTFRHINAPNERWSFRSLADSINDTVVDLETGTGTLTFRQSRDIAVGPNASAPDAPSGEVIAGSHVNISNTSSDSFIALNLTYDPSGIDESTVDLHRFNESSESWEAVPNAMRDTAANEVSANLTSFSVFAPIAESSTNGGGNGGNGGNGGGGGGGGGGGAVAPPPGDFQQNVRVISASLSETRIEPGETVRVTAVVQNDRQSTAQHEVTLFVDGEAVESEYVTVPANDTTEVTFTRSFPDRGQYAIRANDVSAGTLTVAEETPTPTPTTEPTPTPTELTPTPTPTPTDTATVASPSGTPRGLEGIAPFAMALGGIAILSLAGAALYLRFLRP